MSDDAAAPGRTGRGNRGRHPAEAPPPQGQPEDTAGVGEGEAEAAVTEGVYFAKAPGRDVWHGYDEDHVSIGSVFHNGQKWKVRIGREEMPATFGSATSGKAFLMGWWMRGDHDTRNAPAQTLGTLADRLPGRGAGNTVVSGLPGGDQPEGSGTGAVTATGTNAAHDASTTV